MEKDRYWFIRKVIGFLFRLLSRITVEGFENIPAKGPFVLVTNHVSRLDSPLLLVISPIRLYALVADKYRKSLVFYWILKAAGAIWIRRSEFDRQALMAAMDVLKSENVLALAPEGTRSPTGGLQKGKPGAAFLAARSGVPLVPVGITGTETMLKDFLRLRRMDIKVRFGESFYLPKEGRLTSQELEVATDLIMQRIAELLPIEYRGVYRGFVPEDFQSGRGTIVSSA